MKKDYLLKEYYVNYLRSVRKLSESSINHYVGGISSISKILREHGKIEYSIFEINSINELLAVKNYLFSNSDFITKDKVGHSMYSSAFNNYLRFAQGDDFFVECYSYKDIDMPMKVAELYQNESYQQNRRNAIVKNQSIKAVHFMCECDNTHKMYS